MVTQESSLLCSCPWLFNRNPVVKCLQVELNSDHVEHHGRLAKTMGNNGGEGGEMLSKLIQGAETGITVKSKHMDNYAFIICIVIIITNNFK